MAEQHSRNAAIIGGFEAAGLLFEVLREHPGVANSDYGVLVIVCTSLQFLCAIGLYRGYYVSGAGMMVAFLALRIGMLVMGVALSKLAFVLGLGMFVYFAVGVWQLKSAADRVTPSISTRTAARSND